MPLENCLRNDMDEESEYTYIPRTPVLTPGPQVPIDPLQELFRSFSKDLDLLHSSFAVDHIRRAFMRLPTIL